MVIVGTKSYTIINAHVPLSRYLKKKLKKIIVRCPYKDFFGHRFRKKNNSIFGPLTIIPQKTVDQSSGATFEYLSGKKKFVQIGRLLFEIWAKTCRKSLTKCRNRVAASCRGTKTIFCKVVNFSPWPYLSGEKKFVQIGRLLFEIWAKTCRRISKKARPQPRLE